MEIKTLEDVKKLVDILESSGVRKADYVPIIGSCYIVKVTQEQLESLKKENGFSNFEDTYGAPSLSEKYMSTEVGYIHKCRLYL
jgi:hypothetical protein